MTTRWDRLRCKVGRHRWALEFHHVEPPDWAYPFIERGCILHRCRHCRKRR